VEWHFGKVWRWSDGSRVCGIGLKDGVLGGGLGERLGLAQLVVPDKIQRALNDCSVVVCTV